jgi:hypothetical protein
MHDIRPYRSQHRVMIGERGHPPPPSDVSSRDRVGVADSNELAVRESLDRFEVDDRDVSAPDHCCCRQRILPGPRPDSEPAASRYRPSMSLLASAVTSASVSRPSAIAISK